MVKEGVKEVGLFRNRVRSAWIDFSNHQLFGYLSWDIRILPSRRNSSTVEQSPTSLSNAFKRAMGMKSPHWPAFKNGTAVRKVR